MFGMLFGVLWTVLFQSPARRKQRRSERFREMLRNLLQSSGGADRPDEAIHALTGLFMAVVRQNERGLREIHVQMAQQILRIYAAQGGIPTRKMLNSFQQWDAQEIPVKDLTERVNEYYPLEARKNFLHDMMMVAFADGQMQKDEEGILRFLTDRFNLSESDYDRAFQQVKERLQYSDARGRRGRAGGRQSSRGTRSRSGQTLEEAYDTLDLDPGADEDTVKSRYREMAQEYHPDNYSDEDRAEEAQEKMVRINKAYKRIMDSL